MYSLGECYYYGRGVGQSDDMAIKWYIKASEMSASRNMLRDEAYDAEMKDDLI
jgi:TPR repeat protein